MNLAEQASVFFIPKILKIITPKNVLPKIKNSIYMRRECLTGFFFDIAFHKIWSPLRLYFMTIYCIRSDQSDTLIH